MPKEPETYRLNLELLNTLYPEKLAFTVHEIAKMNDWCDATAAKVYPFNGKYISKSNLAYAMAKQGAPTT